MASQNPIVQELNSNPRDGPSPSDTHDRDPAARHQVQAFGQVIQGKGQTYVGASHWAGILEEVGKFPGGMVLYRNIIDRRSPRSSSRVFRR